MELPQTFRDQLAEDLDEFLSNLSDNPAPEVIANFLVDAFEAWADDAEFDEDVVVALEESGALELSLLESLENEMASNDEMEFTDEEILSILDQMCQIEWVDDFGDATEESDDQTEEE